MLATWAKTQPLEGGYECEDEENDDEFAIYPRLTSKCTVFYCLVNTVDSREHGK